MSDPKRLTDEQIAEIKARADWASGLPAGVVSAEKSIADRAALITHCEALLAENAKLRRVVEAAQKLRPMFNLVADEEIELDDALSDLEAANVLDATDDKR